MPRLDDAALHGQRRDDHVLGRLGAAVLGKLADYTSIGFVYHLCAFLPAIGLLAVFLPKMPRQLH